MRHHARRPHSFTGLVCGNCGEMAIGPCARIADGTTVCIPCQQTMGVQAD